MDTLYIINGQTVYSFCNDKCINIECGQACEDYK